MKNIKKMGRWAVLLCTFSAFPHLTEAQAVRQAMVVKFVGQSQGNVFFALADQPKYWVKDNVLHIKSATQSEEYALSSVDEIVFNESLTSNAEQSSANLSFYPNPAESYIRVTGLSPNARVELLDVNGKGLDSFVVSGEGDFSIFVQQLPKGIYFLKINEQPYKFVKK